MGWPYHQPQPWQSIETGCYCLQQGGRKELGGRNAAKMAGPGNVLLLLLQMTLRSPLMRWLSGKQPW